MAVASPPVGSLVACVLMPSGRDRWLVTTGVAQGARRLGGRATVAVVGYFAPRPTATGASTPARSVSRRKKNSVTSTRVIGTSEK